MDVNEQTLMDYLWFSLKVLPQRIYQFDPDMQGRFNPELDHIFPKKLKGRNLLYEQEVDVLWNIQPTKGDVLNSQKTNLHPKEFFTDKAKDKAEIKFMEVSL